MVVLRKINMFRVFTILIGLTLFCTGLSIGQNPQQFQKRWFFDLDESIKIMPQSIRNKYDSLPSEIKTRAVASMTDRAFTFTGDSVNVDWKSRGQSKQSKGTWSFDSAESELLIVVGNDQQRFKVMFHASGDLIVENKRPLGFFSRMYLRKEQ